MAEPYIVKMPQLSDTMTEGVVVSWEKKIGDKVSRGDIVATVETDKAVMDVEVFRDGYLSGPLAAVDSVVPVGGAIAYIVDEAKQVQQGTAAPVAAATATAHDDHGHAHSHDDDHGHATVEDDAAPAGASYTIKMPQLSDTMTEGIVVSWEKKIGDKVARGDIVATVETDKAVMDVEVFRDGYLSGPLAAPDSVIPVGGAMAYLMDSAAAVVQGNRMASAAPKAAAPVKTSTTGVSSAAPAYTANSDAKPVARPANKHATPYARKLAGQMHVNLNNLHGSGPSGVIVAADVAKAQPIERPTEIARPVPAFTMPEVQVPGHGRAMTAMERAVSNSMTASLTMPTFRVMTHAKPDNLIRVAKKSGVSVTVAIAKACAIAIQKHPRMNWAYQPVDKLVERANVDIGMAVASDDGGLVVPVLRKVESRELSELVKDWDDLVKRARKRRLSPEEYANPTFMVSNMGMLGVAYFDAIPTPGTAAILAISATGAQGMPLTITADHRVVNGSEVAIFLNTLKNTIEQPEAWMSGGGPAIPEGNWD
ncbi:MAG: 2-oxo acid dehydrogenase subunit E2, partial [Gammaproteobacteria bacterium]|nr:2-oxo acid dehydrogenase subunit E2 [Gammaproteobacteria bacterium]